MDKNEEKVVQLREALLDLVPKEKNVVAGTLLDALIAASYEAGVDSAIVSYTNKLKEEAAKPETTNEEEA